MKTNINKIYDTIKDCARACGRNPEDIHLIAVSKYVSSQRIKQVYEDYGLRHFGENRIQDLIAKSKELPSDIKWNMIGHLQTNKAKLAVEVSSIIHSVDSIRLLTKIDFYAKNINKQQEILLQLNLSNEPNKTGAPISLLDELLETTINLSNVRCTGLMTMAPFNASHDTLENIFGDLRDIRNRMEDKFQLCLPNLSMGMSSDYDVAIRYGATFIRIGTAIFGTGKSI